MNPPPLDSTEFKNAITNYKPKIRDFFVTGANNFSNYKMISQGEVGDCWFLSPLAAISRSPVLRRTLEGNFVTNPDRTYDIKLFQAGEESGRSIAINGNLIYIPKVKGFKSDLLFAGQQQFLPEKRAVPFESLWFAFIEKALAILYGGYHLLDGGDPDKPGAKQADLGFFHLTGKKVTTIPIDSTTNFTSTIKSMLDRGAAIVYTTKANKELPSGRKIKESPDGTDESRHNLLEDHAYVVDSITDEGIVTLYNPHGEFRHLAINIAKPMSQETAIFYGKRLDVLLVPIAGKRKTHRSKNNVTVRSKRNYRI